MKVINFLNALQLEQCGFLGKAEKSYKYDTITVKQEINDNGLGVQTASIEVWDKNMDTVVLDDYSSNHQKLSDRFYDSWNDKHVAAYNALELTQFAKLSVDIDTDPDEIAEKIIMAYTINKMNFTYIQY